jgi:hypothetical protein
MNSLKATGFHKVRLEVLPVVMTFTNRVLAKLTVVQREQRKHHRADQTLPSVIPNRADDE